MENAPFGDVLTTRYTDPVSPRIGRGLNKELCILQTSSVEHTGMVGMGFQHMKESDLNTVQLGMRSDVLPPEQSEL